MPRLSKLSGSESISHVSIVSLTLLDLLTPALSGLQYGTRVGRRTYKRDRRHFSTETGVRCEVAFYAAISQASVCDAHQHKVQSACVTLCQRNRRNARQISIANNGCSRTKLHGEAATINRGLTWERSSYTQPIPKRDLPYHEVQKDNHTIPALGCGISKDHGIDSVDTVRPRRNISARARVLSCYELTSRLSEQQRLTNSVTRSRRKYHTQTADQDLKRRKFTEASNSPPKFFDDISSLHNVAPTAEGITIRKVANSVHGARIRTFDAERSEHSALLPKFTDKIAPDIDDRFKLMTSVRELEGRLEKARKDLARSMVYEKRSSPRTNATPSAASRPPIVLTKDDYKNLVDLYYYSHNSRFSPESTDASPTPLILEDYSFTLSADFSPGSPQTESVNEDENYESPLKQIEEMLKQRQLREIAVMQVFVDLLLDDHSSNRALYEAYKELPDPGIEYLPTGIIRLFLQRMSTPWTVSEKSMLRYLSLIDDMQKAKIPIAVSEWSSAVYLAGRAFSKVTQQDVKHAFDIWQSMEREAGVKASHVTFNILFDIAVRSGKFALGETILREMHSRNLRLNRLGRVSLMYYHGLRKDGDGVRKAYRDFVEAGEIVDTLVLNCVIASLLNAQEPQAAEQVYARMKNMQSTLRKGFDRDGDEVLYKRYPDPGANTIANEMASNHIGRILQRAPRLKKLLPQRHEDLQAQMPLTPDHVTFRALIAYHTTTSGDLDRLTVLLQDMIDFFQLPLQTVTFQLLFKGFAIHGPMGGPDSAWSARRLDMCWNACREAIKEGQSVVNTSKPLFTQDSSIGANARANGITSGGLTLPSITQINTNSTHTAPFEVSLPLSRPPPKQLSNWSEFVLDLAAFPRERLKRLERFHSTMFDAEDIQQPHEKPGIHTFQSPFFQSIAYTAPEPQLDTEEGEYELPNPAESGFLHNTMPSSSEVDVNTSSDADEYSQLPKPGSHHVAATKPLVCWLLRAYSRTTKSRTKVEEIWGQVRKVSKPWDAMERESVVRVLRRCLRDCDREGSG